MCVCTHTCFGMNSRTTVCVGVEDNLQESVFSFYYVSSIDYIYVLRFGANTFSYLLGHPTCLQIFFFSKELILEDMETQWWAKMANTFLISPSPSLPMDTSYPSSVYYLSMYWYIHPSFPFFFLLSFPALWLDIFLIWNFWF